MSDKFWKPYVAAHGVCVGFAVRWWRWSGGSLTPSDRTPTMGEGYTPICLNALWGCAGVVASLPRLQSANPCALRLLLIRNLSRHATIRLSGPREQKWGCRRSFRTLHARRPHILALSGNCLTVSCRNNARCGTSRPIIVVHLEKRTTSPISGSLVCSRKEAVWKVLQSTQIIEK